MWLLAFLFSSWCGSIFTLFSHYLRLACPDFLNAGPVLHKHCCLFYSSLSEIRLSTQDPMEHLRGSAFPTRLCSCKAKALKLSALVLLGILGWESWIERGNFNSNWPTPRKNIKTCWEITVELQSLILALQNPVCPVSVQLPASWPDTV